MPIHPKISQVPIYTVPTSAPTPSASTDSNERALTRRWQGCKISADVAAALGIPVEDLGSSQKRYQIRIGVTQADVNVLFNPDYLEFLGKGDSFVVDGVATGSYRVEIYANSGPGAKDGGVFKLFGGGNPFSGAEIPTNARVTLWCEELATVPISESPVSNSPEAENENTEPSKSSDREVCRSSRPDQQPARRRGLGRWLLTLPVVSPALF